MEDLLEHLIAQIPEVFETDDYRSNRREEIVKEFTSERNNLLQALEKKGE